MNIKFSIFRVWFWASQVCVAAVGLYIIQLHGVIAPICTTQIVEYYDSVQADEAPTGKTWKKK